MSSFPPMLTNCDRCPALYTELTSMGQITLYKLFDLLYNRVPKIQEYLALKWHRYTSGLSLIPTSPLASPKTWRALEKSGKTILSDWLLHGNKLLHPMM